MKFGTFWIGRPLSKIEWLCLSSFVYYGHEITVFVYDLELKLPNGVIKRDANEILPESAVFMANGSYAPFADLFRYRMISLSGLIWTDIDNVCLRSDWDLGDYCFGKQDSDTLANGIIKAPKDSKLILDLVEQSSNFDKSKIKWQEIGPSMLTKLVKENNLFEFAKDSHTFYPIEYRDWGRLWSAQFADQVEEYIKDSYTLQIWNHMVNLGKFKDRDDLVPNSILDRYYKKFC